MFLSELKLYESGIIVNIHKNNKDRNVLFNLGFMKDRDIKLIRIAPLHNPYLYKISGNYIMLRKDDCKDIEIIKL